MHKLKTHPHRFSNGANNPQRPHQLWVNTFRHTTVARCFKHQQLTCLKVCKFDLWLILLNIYLPVAWGFSSQILPKKAMKSSCVCPSWCSHQVFAASNWNEIRMEPFIKSFDEVQRQQFANCSFNNNCWISIPWRCPFMHRNELSWFGTTIIQKLTIETWALTGMLCISEIVTIRNLPDAVSEHNNERVWKLSLHRPITMPLRLPPNFVWHFIAGNLDVDFLHIAWIWQRAARHGRQIAVAIGLTKALGFQRFLNAFVPSHLDQTCCWPRAKNVFAKTVLLNQQLFSILK